MNAQISLFDDTEELNGKRKYRPVLTAIENMKGVLDVDTVKGCTLGMSAYPATGCYGECYANKIAVQYGIDFTVSVSRKLTSFNRGNIFRTVRDHSASWYRIGTAGEPCHDWENTLEVCEFLKETGKIPVIITKHWIPLSDVQIKRLKNVGAVVNTSVSGLDTDAQLKHRVSQIKRLKSFGVRSVARIVSCNYGNTEWAQQAKAKQDYLMTLLPIIDNPLRAYKSNNHVMKGEIILTRIDEAVGGGKLVSLNNAGTYLGTCSKCPDQCGVEETMINTHKENKMKNELPMLISQDQTGLFDDKVEWVYVKSVIGSGYEEDVSRLAITS